MTFPVRFECTSCGKCCTFTGPRQYVFVSIAEAQRIAKFAGLTFAETTERDAKGRLSLRCVVTPDGGACRFLKDNRCSVYEVRPRQCRSFPFWPDHLKSAEAWAAVPCEGVGRGELISVAEVLAKLRR
jgi:Fe-S-cluster containining protein